MHGTFLRFTGYLLLCLVGLTGLVAAPAETQSGYQSHLPPRALTFRTPTPGFDPADPARELGNFRAGLSVDVVEARPEQGRWLVEYRRTGQSNIQALIPIPSLANPDSPDFGRMVDLLKGFPLLHRVLESDQPWPAAWVKSPQGILSKSVSEVKGGGDQVTRFLCSSPKTNTVWGLVPMRAYYDVSNPERPKFVLEFWSKGEAFRFLGFRDEPARNELRRNLQQIANFFDSSGRSTLRERGSNQHIRGIRDSIDIFLLPNDTRVSIHYHRGEYLLVEIDQASVADRHQTVVRSPGELTAFLREKVTERPDGARYISGIPMIDQGETSYCVPATMARVLNFYGYDITPYSLAMLAGTMEQISLGGGGTTKEDTLRSLRRITNGSPFRLREVKDSGLASIAAVTDGGVPIIWAVPGHIRLLIGVNPKTQQVVYSDSWGPGHDYKLASYYDFRRLNLGMWVLDPR